MLCVNPLILLKPVNCSFNLSLFFFFVFFFLIAFFHFISASTPQCNFTLYFWELVYIQFESFFFCSSFFDCIFPFSFCYVWNLICPNPYFFRLCLQTHSPSLIVFLLEKKMFSLLFLFPYFLWSFGGILFSWNCIWFCICFWSYGNFWLW